MPDSTKPNSFGGLPVKAEAADWWHFGLGVVAVLAVHTVFWAVAMGSPDSKVVLPRELPDVVIIAVMVAGASTGASLFAAPVCHGFGFVSWLARIGATGVLACGGAVGGLFVMGFAGGWVAKVSREMEQLVAGAVGLGLVFGLMFAVGVLLGRRGKGQ